nr:MAG TPA: hypothetical protein [Caudoviricetes sp.]
MTDFKEKNSLTANEYQKLAQRTMSYQNGMTEHALHGMASEVGELHSLYQKVYQGHEFDGEHAKKEVGDILWFIAEYCTAMGWQLEDVMEMNIEKLKARYPKGFEAERSLNRVEGDI